MQQGFLTTILTLLLYFTSLGGGELPQSSDQGAEPAPSWTEDLSSSQSQPAILTGKAVNIRSGPGSEYPLIATLEGGTMVNLEATSLGWGKVRTGDGKVGWVPMWLVSTSEFDLKNAAPAAPQNKGQREIYGYYVDASSYRSAEAFGKLLTGIIPFSYNITAQGIVTGNHDQNAANLAKLRSLSNYALIHNISGSNFDGELVHQVLSSSTRRAALVNNIYKLLKNHGYDGVNIDFENLRPSDRHLFNTFIRELAAKLKPAGLRLTISVPAKTADYASSAWVGAFDYATLGGYADRIMLMTYDEHSIASGPGPVASIGWVERVLRYATSQIPADKIILGLAGYGYDWTGFGKARALTYPQIMNLLKKHDVRASWDAASKSPYFTYFSGGQRHTVWYENSASLTAKVDLVARWGIRGVALWRLGFEDQRLWQVVKEKLWL